MQANAPDSIFMQVIALGIFLLIIDIFSYYLRWAISVTPPVVLSPIFTFISVSSGR